MGDNLGPLNLLPLILFDIHGQDGAFRQPVTESVKTECQPRHGSMTACLWMRRFPSFSAVDGKKRRRG